MIAKFFRLLTQRERRNLYLLFVAVLIMAGLEVVSVASIMPFLSVASDPSSVQENTYLNWAFETLDFSDTDTFLVALGFGALAMLVLSNAFIVFTTWAIQRYAWGRNHSISRKLLSSYLYQPYEYFLNRNSAELSKNILEEVKAVASSMLKPVLRGTAKGIVALFIVAFLFFVDPIVAGMVTLVLGGAYTGIYLYVQDWIDQMGEARVDANTKRYQVVSEAFGGI